MDYMVIRKQYKKLIRPAIYHDLFVSKGWLVVATGPLVMMELIK